MGTKNTFVPPKMATLAVAVTLATAASAEGTVPSLDLRGFNPPADPSGGLYYEPAASPDTWEWNAAWYNSYSWRSATLRDPVADDVTSKVVEHQLSGDVVVNMGLLERLAVGLDLPYVMFQTGDDPTADTTAVLGDYALPTAALGDLKLLLKGTIVPPTNQEFGGFALALHERLALPTGSEASFLGEGHIASETRLLVEYRYLAVAIHGAAGIRVRAEEEEYGCAALPEAAECETTFGHELPWGLSLSFQPQAIGLDEGGHWTWFVESFGYVPVAPEAPFSNAAVSQVQLGGGARFAFADDFSVLAAVDTALVSGIGTSPLRATLALAWAPRSHDLDEDGVRDEQDLCPDLKEDRDGHEDQDGCPDWDNDDDLVPDQTDQCPGEKEDEDGFEDDDGCFDPDNDADGIPDVADHCPMVPGIASEDPTQRGCPDRDPDKDKVEGEADECPNVPEDPDGFEDDDGCPDPDNDGDGVADGDDPCPDVAGREYEKYPEDRGCPDSDEDGIPDGKDACPKDKGEASDEAGKHGCPETEAAPGAGRPGGSP
ncbi:MAG: hypothetical protein DRI90_06120 [Deltaproteobacteria bacterium]|nr:MAG: hypothetical protein DRI90_06120 [Deltaproteobacteria bacterium]